MTAVRDRECQNLTVCDFPRSYEHRAPSVTSDRVCAAVVGCQPDVEWEQQQPTPTSQRVCNAVTVCTGERYEMVPATLTTDAICADIVAAATGSSVANLTLAIDFATLDTMGALVFANQLLVDLSSLLQIDRSRLVVSRLLPGSIIAEVLIQPQDGQLSPIEAIQRLQALHSNPNSQLYDSSRYSILSQIDPQVQIRFQGMRDGISGRAVLGILAFGGSLAAIGLCLLMAAKRSLRPGRRYTEEEDAAAAQPEGHKTLFVALGAVSFLLHLLFRFVVLQEAPEFAFESSQFAQLEVYTTATIFGIGPLSVATTALMLAQQKRRLTTRADLLDAPRLGRKEIMLGVLALFQPELLPFLPWHRRQAKVTTVAVALLGVSESVVHLMLQMDYSSRRGGFDLKKASGCLAAAAMAATILSLLVRVLGRYAQLLHHNYAARVRRLRTKMKVVPRPPPTLKLGDRTKGPSDADDADSEKTRKFLPTDLMAGLSKESMTVDGRPCRGTIAPGGEVEKTWVLSNLGSVPWPKQSRLVEIGGDDPGLDVVGGQPIVPGWVGPGRLVTMTLRLRCPEVAGPYVKYFQLKDPEGHIFGQRIWASATVRSTALLPPIDIVQDGESRRTDSKVDADRKRKGSEDTPGGRVRDTRPIAHTAGFSLALWPGGTARSYQQQYEDPQEPTSSSTLASAAPRKKLGY